MITHLCTEYLNLVQLGAPYFVLTILNANWMWCHFLLYKISGVPRGGGGGCCPPPPKFRRYRWSPQSHKQEEPASRFPFV